MHSSTPPPLPSAACFRTTVHGTIFCDRSAQLARIHAGDPLLIIPGPPCDDEPGTWVHMPDGELVGHLPPEIEAWLTPWLLRGGHATARALRVGGSEVPSWRRLLIEVSCNSLSCFPRPAARPESGILSSNPPPTPKRPS
jgi:hypothetical protein